MRAGAAKPNLHILILLGGVIIVFLLNFAHQAQQGSFAAGHLALAKSLAAGHGYAMIPGEPLFSPLWGYALLTAALLPLGSPECWLWLAQLLLCLAALVVFYRTFALTPKGWHLVLLLPFAALMSVKWPDAPTGCLLFLLWAGLRRYVSDGKRSALLVAGCLAALLANFRSEYLLFPAALALPAALPSFREWRRRLLTAAIVLLLAMIAGLAPWSWRAHRHGGPWLLSATNGGGVAYISLGQLPGNPWGIRPVDETMWAQAEKNGLASPFTFAGNALLLKDFRKAVAAHPVAFAGKALLNMGRVAIGGLYVGEYDAWLISPARRGEIGEIISREGRFAALRDVWPSEAAALVAQFVFHKLYAVLFFGLIVAWIVAGRRMRRGEQRLLFALATTLFVYKIVLVGLLQYEPRHINAVYLPLLGLVMTALPGRRRRRAADEE